ncbi:amidohydrolase family protein [Actinomadura livida]|uniref:Amidohydrolase family protein n=1 Tax=Actinomadura livida TaxID=79909 RepID=A0A7W7I8A6_9ACTN|nr:MULTISPECIES: amidohydrolase family protein [Actinomadura]MBB4772329.1 cytosine deaminase [Actinomadura catellatispora]GGU23757.1 cytosine deaminase [Actinomadura livida]
MPPEADPLLIRGARLLDSADPVDVHLADGRIAAIGDLTAPPSAKTIDADGGLLTPAFVEPHFHIDKALTHPHLPPTGHERPLDAALERTRHIKARYTPDGLRERAATAIRLAVGHGVGTLRAHVDVDPVGGLSALGVLADLRDRHRDMIDIQLVAFPQESIVRDPGALRLLREALTSGADVLGGAPDVEEPRDRHRHVDLLVELAAETGADLDVHCDYSYDPGQRDLEMLARLTVEAGLTGRVRAGHCCALDAYDDMAAAEVIDAVLAARIDLCVCPMGNLLLVGDPSSPFGRGAARLHELLARGVTVAAGGDNMNDMWFPFGRLDPAEVAMVTAIAARMWSDRQLRQVFDMVTVNAAHYVGAPAEGVRPGAVADLVLFSTARLTDVLRNAPGRRTTIKRGRVVGGADSSVWTT